MFFYKLSVLLSEIIRYDIYLPIAEGELNKTFRLLQAELLTITVILNNTRKYVKRNPHMNAFYLRYS
jgi:hypothetical protein